MKKTLLLGSFAIFALVANAQLKTEADADYLSTTLELTTDAQAKPAGMVIATGEAGTISTAYDDSWKIFTPAGNYKNVKVGDVELSLGNGVTGNTNPTFSSYADGVMSAGAVYKIVPTADGWLTVFTKLNTNKQYVVFGNTTLGMAYQLGWTNGTEKIDYTIPYNEDGTINFEDPNIADYIIDGDVKPQFPCIVAGYSTDEDRGTTNPGENTGFVTFKAYEGVPFYFAALGSKAACGNFVLTTGDCPSVTFYESGEYPEVTFEPGFESAGVESIIADPANENAPIYNVLGQKVDANAKGILIQNGKKFIRR